MSLPNKFTVRVYGILIYQQKVLVTDEIIENQPYVKFPGGGVEFGESPFDALTREFFEELNIKLLEIEHFYTLDKFVTSKFNANYQVLAIYYLVRVNNPSAINVKDNKFDFTVSQPYQIFRWINLNDLNPNEFELLPDRLAVEKLKLHFRLKPSN